MIKAYANLFHADPYRRAMVIIDAEWDGRTCLSEQQLAILCSDPVWLVRGILAHYRSDLPKDVLSQLQNDPEETVRDIAAFNFNSMHYFSKKKLLEILYLTMIKQNSVRLR